MVMCQEPARKRDKHLRNMSCMLANHFADGTALARLLAASALLLPEAAWIAIESSAFLQLH